MERILIIKLSAIGDVVQALPAVEAIKKARTGCSVDWVVEEAAADILEGHPAIDRLLISHRKSWLAMLRRPSTAGKGIRAICRFIRDLRAVRYDIAVDLQGLFKSGVVMGFARAVRKVGFARSRELSAWFLNERLPPYDLEKHALERYLDVARYLGAQDPVPACSLPMEREAGEMRRRLAGAVPEGKRIVVINPMARWGTKLWREDRFAELADRLVRERNAAVIFTGSPADRVTNARISGMMRERAVDWTGATTLKELAALARLADLFISTDTGPMHLAAAAGGRVLALFGPTAPWRTGPYGERHVVVRAGTVCSPCFGRECRSGQRCMEEITVGMVMERLPF